MCFGGGGHATPRPAQIVEWILPEQRGGTMSHATRGISSKLVLRLREAAIGGAIGCIALGLSDVNAADAAPAEAAADENSQGGGQLEEVVVTAQKREESLQKVPLSV